MDDSVDFQKLYTEFNTARDSIEIRINSLKSVDELNEIRSSIKELSNDFSKDDSNILQIMPSYDQRQYLIKIDQLLSDLEKRKQELTKPKRFTFKNRKPKTVVEPLKAEPVLESHVTKKPDIENLHDETYVIPESYTKVYIDKITNCIIKTPLNTQLQSIHISQLVKSQLDLRCQTSIFIDTLSECEIHTTSQQLRLLSVTNCKLVPEITNDSKTIVIEKSHHLLIDDSVKVDDFDNPTNLKKNDNYEYFKYRANQ